MAEQTNSIEKLRGLLEGIDFTMMTTVSGGKLHSRPMSTQEMDDDGCLWFFSRDNTHKADEIAADDRVNCAYSDKDGNTYVSVFGHATVSHDKVKMKELWNPIHKAWFPDGLEDPNICLIKVEVEEAEYWDAPSSTLVQLAGFVKAIVTGKEADYGENKTIAVNS
ncbi:MAG TPA: pyridoxamine 5'-phosphate oxidase family protein [Pyrinomonadaceae bacterium]|jgi:general stress protein 26|nr:pyridoxamine 5'-phosphate oxidase family protein [Pyrinomonadaceae bacterium]